MENNLKISTVTKRIGFLIGIAIFLFSAGLTGWYIYRDKVEKVEVEPEPETTKPGLVADLDREIIIKADISEEAKNRAIAEIKIITATLKADYDRREEWLNLGIWRKTIGDYEGAEQAWKFATIIRPNDPVAFHNLGDLYSQYLPDFSKAEKYYLAAIEKDTSQQPFFYVKLYEFYLYYYKKPDLAEKTLLDALKTNPDNEYLQKILDDFRKERY
jgi:tetratricopeptide (TPR) repeat protein